MKRINVRDAEMLALKFRTENGFSYNEPLDMKTVLRKCNILTVYRPLSEKAYGMSLRSKSGDKFVLINSTRTLGRQHFTIAHELYHLFYDENPRPHVCGPEADSVTERNANLFASVLLMPKESILQQISAKETVGNSLSIATVLRLEQLYGVSRESMLYRLKAVGIIGEDKLQELLKLPKVETAKEYGYDVSLYLPGNDGLVIGNMVAMARELYEMGKISEGHYVELLNMIS